MNAVRDRNGPGPVNQDGPEVRPPPRWVRPDALAGRRQWPTDWRHAPMEPKLKDSGWPCRISHSKMGRDDCLPGEPHSGKEILQEFPKISKFDA